jgi:hypothetical protein
MKEVAPALPAGVQKKMGGQDGEGKWVRESIAFQTQGGRNPYELPKMMARTEVISRSDERAVWLWHPAAAQQGLDGAPAEGSVPDLTAAGGGFIRPSYTRTSNNYCLHGARFWNRNLHSMMLLDPTIAGVEARVHGIR